MSVKTSKEELYGRVFIEHFPDWDELHISFGDEEHEACRELVNFFKVWTVNVESDGFGVIISQKKGKKA